jgi:hypothetical protein
MRIHPFVRMLLIGTGLAVALRLDGAAIAPCAITIAATYLLLGRAKMLAHFAILVSPFLVTAAALWIFVYHSTEVNLQRAIAMLFEPGSRFLVLVRTMLGTAVIFLALRAVPDGELYFVLRRMGLPRTAALLFASGNGLVGTVREAVERSLVALRAHGVMRTTIASRVANIGRALGLTWISGLTITAVRAEVKWSGNGFLRQLEAESSPVSVTRSETLVAASGAVAMLLLILLPSQTRHAFAFL